MATPTRTSTNSRRQTTCFMHRCEARPRCLRGTSINSLFPGGGTTDQTGSYTATQRYDEVKVRAILHEIAGLDSTGSKSAPVPAIFGMTFQSVSVAQKLAQSGPSDPPDMVGGYADGNGTPNNALSGALTFVDNALGRMVDGDRTRRAAPAG
jgi:hypothetical protein